MEYRLSPHEGNAKYENRTDLAAAIYAAQCWIKKEPWRRYIYIVPVGKKLIVATIYSQAMKENALKQGMIFDLADQGCGTCVTERYKPEYNI